MRGIKRLWSRIAAFFSFIMQTAGLLSAILTILAVLGFGSAAFGYYSKILPLVIIGIVIILLSVLIFIFLYTLLEEQMKVKQTPSNPQMPSYPSIYTLPTQREDSPIVKPILTNPVVYSLPSQHEKHTLELTPTDTRIYPPPPWEDDVEILLKEIIYEYARDSQTMWQRKRMQMQVFRNGMTHFTDRYRWSGNGKCFVQSLTSGYTIANEHKENDWNYFDVLFSRPVRRGEVVDFTIEWELFDEKKLAVPFLSTMIDRDTNHLLLQVILPRELAPKSAYCHEFADYADTLPIATQEIHCSPTTRILSYDILHPKKNHKYLIRWYLD